MAEVIIPGFDPIVFLLQRKFGRSGDFEGTSIVSKKMFSLAELELQRNITAYRTHLTQLPPEEFQALVDAERKKFHEETVAEAERQERARFYNRPGAQADFEHWSKAAHWTLDEAIALSFGKAPEQVTWEKVQRLARGTAFAFQYARRRDLALRAVVWKQLFDPVLPGIFLAWAKRTELDLPPELEAAVTARGVQIADWKTFYDREQAAHAQTRESVEAEVRRTLEQAEALTLGKQAVAERDATIADLGRQIEELRSAASKPDPDEPASATNPLGQRERESMLRLIIGMAMRGYCYDPAALKNSAVGEIASDLSELGIGLDEDTIRKYLREGRELVPRES